MTITIGQRGQVVIPKAIRESRQIEAGDDFEVILDDADADLILLRKIRPGANAGSVATNNVPDFTAVGVKVLNPFD